jgi:hypothetical protein
MLAVISAIFTPDTKLVYEWDIDVYQNKNTLIAKLILSRIKKTLNEDKQFLKNNPMPTANNITISNLIMIR